MHVTGVFTHALYRTLWAEALLIAIPLLIVFSGGIIYQQIVAPAMLCGCLGCLILLRINAAQRYSVQQIGITRGDEQYRDLLLNMYRVFPLQFSLIALIFFFNACSTIASDNPVMTALWLIVTFFIAFRLVTVKRPEPPGPAEHEVRHFYASVLYAFRHEALCFVSLIVLIALGFLLTWEEPIMLIKSILTLILCISLFLFINKTASAIKHPDTLRSGVLINTALRDHRPELITITAFMFFFTAEDFMNKEWPFLIFHAPLALLSLNLMRERSLPQPPALTNAPTVFDTFDH